MFAISSPDELLVAQAHLAMVCYTAAPSLHHKSNAKPVEPPRHHYTKHYCTPKIYTQIYMMYCEPLPSAHRANSLPTHTGFWLRCQDDGAERPAPDDVAIATTTTTSQHISLPSNKHLTTLLWQPWQPSQH